MHDPVDTDAVLRWQRLWGLARGLPPADRLDGALRIPYGGATRQLEYLVFDDAAVDDVATLAARTRAAWVTVVTPDPLPISARLAARGLHLRSASETLMVIEWADHPRRPLPEGYRVQSVQDAPHVVTVRVVDAAGELAAQGTLAVEGGDAVPDRIETQRTHRRRGLGAAVMSALADRARDEGATHGLLIASIEGERLYSSLGWRALSPVVVAVSRI